MALVKERSQNIPLLRRSSFQRNGEAINIVLLRSEELSSIQTLALPHKVLDTTSDFAYYPRMGSIHLVIPQKEEPPALHERAMDNLKYIRETMERATAFTAISGWGQVAIGITALATTFISAQQKSFKGWLAVWVAEAVIALLIAGWSMDRKARAAKMPLLSGPGRKVRL